METSSALLAICAGNSPVPGEFRTQRPMTRSFDVFFDLRLNKRLSKQWWGWWFETLSCPLWRHCNGYTPTAATLNLYGRNSGYVISLKNKYDIIISCAKFGCFLAFRIRRGIGKCALLCIKFNFTNEWCLPHTCMPQSWFECIYEFIYPSFVCVNTPSRTTHRCLHRCTGACPQASNCQHWFYLGKGCRRYHFYLNQYCLIITQIP